MTRRAGIFCGWRVVGAAFVLAVLGWGIGFYDLPVYLQAIQENRGWPVALISTAVTAHFVIGAVVGGQSADSPGSFRHSEDCNSWRNLLGCRHPRLGQRDRTLATPLRSSGRLRRCRVRTRTGDLRIFAGSKPITHGF
jgi:hypothetical protein